MFRTTDIRRPTRLLPLLAGGLLLSACAATEPPGVPEATPVDTTVEPTGTVAEPAAPLDVPPRPSPTLPPPAPDVVVVVGSSGDAHDRLLDALTSREPAPRVVTIGGAIDAASALRDGAVDAVIAVGAEAAEFAVRHAQAPVVICEVFEALDSPLRANDTWFVSAIPEFHAQLGIWVRLDASIATVGIIVGPGHGPVVEAARDAARRIGIGLEVRESASDRETQYLFRDMLASLDGFLLLPDSRVLSPTVLRSMFRDAAEADVQMAIVNPSLASLGATLTFTPKADALARAALSKATQLARGERAGIARETTVREMEVALSATESRRLNLATVGDEATIRIY